MSAFLTTHLSQDFQSCDKVHQTKCMYFVGGTFTPKFTLLLQEPTVCSPGLPGCSSLPFSSQAAPKFIRADPLTAGLGSGEEGRSSSPRQSLKRMFWLCCSIVFPKESLPSLDCLFICTLAGLPDSHHLLFLCLGKEISLSSLCREPYKNK